VGGERAARCLREKRARKRAARGEVSVVRIVRRARTVGSEGVGVLKMDILKECMFQCIVGCWSGDLEVGWTGVTVYESLKPKAEDLIRINLNLFLLRGPAISEKRVPILMCGLSSSRL
jgi:hypothetical protein